LGNFARRPARLSDSTGAIIYINRSIPLTLPASAATVRLQPRKEPAMKSLKFLGIAGAVAAALLAGAPSAQAQATQLFSPTSGETTVPTLPDGTSVSGMGNDTDPADTALKSGFTVASGGNTFTFASSDGTDLTRHNAGDTINGDTTAYPTGTRLLETLDPNGTSGVGNGPLTISFSNPVTKFGLFAQDFTPDTQTFTFSTFSGTTDVGNFTVGPIDNNSSPGQLAFVGAAYAPGITSIKISSASVDSTGSTFGSNDFYVGPAAPSAPVPEAATTISFGLMLGMGGLGLLVSRNKRRKQGAAENA